MSLSSDTTSRAKVGSSAGSYLSIATSSPSAWYAAVIAVMAASNSALRLWTVNEVDVFAGPLQESVELHRVAAGKCEPVGRAGGEADPRDALVERVHLCRRLCPGCGQGGETFLPGSPDLCHEVQGRPELEELVTVDERGKVFDGGCLGEDGRVHGLDAASCVKVAAWAAGPVDVVGQFHCAGGWALELIQAVDDDVRSAFPVRHVVRRGTLRRGYGRFGYLLWWDDDPSSQSKLRRHRFLPTSADGRCGGGRVGALRCWHT